MPFYTPTPLVNFNYKPNPEPNIGQAYLNAQQRWANQDYVKQKRDLELQNQEALLANRQLVNQQNQQQIDEATLDKHLGDVFQSSIDNGMLPKQAYRNVIAEAYRVGGLEHGNREKADAQKNFEEVLKMIPTLKGKAKTQAQHYASDLYFSFTGQDINPADLESPEKLSVLRGGNRVIAVDSKGAIKSNKIIDPNKEAQDNQIFEAKLANQQNQVNVRQARLSLEEQKIAQQQQADLINKAKNQEIAQVMLQEIPPEDKFKQIAQIQIKNGDEEGAIKTLKNSSQLKKYPYIKQYLSEYDTTNKKIDKIDWAIANAKAITEQKVGLPSEGMAFIASFGSKQIKDPKILIKNLKALRYKEERKRNKLAKMLQKRGYNLDYETVLRPSSETIQTTGIPEPKKGIHSFINRLKAGQQ